MLGQKDSDMDPILESLVTETPEKIQEQYHRSFEKIQRARATYVSWRALWIWCLAGAIICGSVVFVSLLGEEEHLAGIVSITSISGAIGGFLLWGYFRLLSAIQLKILARTLVAFGTTSLQEKLEEDFFTKLVKINFKYLDQYYLQTQAQADKGFALSAAVSVIALLIIVAGIGMMFAGKTEASYVSVAAGVLSEFIASVFFFLYNRTVTKMGEYHQKLVLTQNVGLALKISENLPEAERVSAQRALIDRLTENVNTLLTQAPSEK